jgi:hypothetical protein
MVNNHASNLEVTDLNLGVDTGCSDEGVLRFSSVLPGEYWDNA